jgi:hypothetical protein
MASAAVNPAVPIFMASIVLMPDGSGITQSPLTRAYSA